jgi:hypothetical protein
MQADQSRLVKTARLTGIWYLALGITGMVGFLVIHPKIYITDDPSQTLLNLSEKELLARVRLVFEFLIVVSQALAAVWFYKLFRSFDESGAWALGIWGTVNSVVIMISGIAMATAIELATSSVQPVGDKVMAIELLQQISNNSWGVGSLFFGLWLLPMGAIVIRSGRMPVWMGRILIIGGAGYILHTFIGYLGYSNSYLELMVIPATIGEFWMIGYLLIFGIRPEAK